VLRLAKSIVRTSRLEGREQARAYPVLDAVEALDEHACAGLVGPARREGDVPDRVAGLDCAFWQLIS